MKDELIFNTDLHFEHETWRSELDFWQDELESFQNRLNELVMNYTDKDIYANVEKFQNQQILNQPKLQKICCQKCGKFQKVRTVKDVGLFAMINSEKVRRDIRGMVSIVMKTEYQVLFSIIMQRYFARFQRRIRKCR